MNHNAPQPTRRDGRAQQMSPAQNGATEGRSLKREFSESSDNIQMNKVRSAGDGIGRYLGVEDEHRNKKPKPAAPGNHNRKGDWKQGLGLILASCSGLALTPRELIECQDLKTEFDALKDSMKQKSRISKRLENEMKRGSSQMKLIFDKHRAIVEPAKKLRAEQDKKADDELMKAAADLRAQDGRPKETILEGEEEGEIVIKEEKL
ncbi:hypothetical protein HYALB_00014067 [Hymenoscyphus albidus]|uniref:Uncharacterized protein n=1 Tax=Hymenoscyphus albidus TaxID=595503 RepID=A0A9N9QAY0_9HELO|nr:hypothetical protein HYALB_00007529 [Hymenoscyphus albidus]CAG8980912.1 hypothetical protein HYALB_00012792 [Hymenoscyphus albidus]CAG8982411.1 hypothetical protein HYALB_00014067 [Hymenoscyphus albidus]